MKGTNKSLRRRVYIFVFVNLICSPVVAQNVNFSQYINTPFFTNPALLGGTNEISFKAIHRSQPLTEMLKYNTSSAMFVKPIMNSTKRKRLGGWGLSLLNDEVKGGIDFRTQGISGSYAYNLMVAQKQFISFGLQAGFYQRNISTGGLTTSNQWLDNTGFVSSIGTGETFVDGRKNYLALSSGFLYYKEDDKHRQVAKFGFAAFNLNQPDVSFTEYKSSIPVKVTAHGSLALIEKNNILFQGEMLYFRENAKNTYHIGSRASYYFDKANPFYGSVDFKLGYRVNNAITTEVQFHQPNFTLAFAYDFGMATKESYRSPNDVPEIMFTVRKYIGIKKKEKVKGARSYTTLEKVNDYYLNEKNSENNEDSTSEGVSPIPDGGFKVKHDFKFKYNEATLNEESKAYLDGLVALMKKDLNIRLDVIGHTDNVGSEEANRKISMLRAQVAIDYMMKNGIEAARLKAIPMGNKQPLVRNESEAGRMLNRRVEFVIYNQATK